MEPINSLSPIAKFIEKNPSGGLHHICFTTKDAEGSLQQIKKKGVKVLGNGEVSTGHHGRDIFFMHPKNTLGTLIEIEQNGNKGAKF